MEKIKQLLKKYKSLISYAFFGVCTTVINVVIYYLLYTVLSAPNVFSTCVAWLGSVIFAFITNKLFVFESKSLKPKVLLKETASFFGCRILTGVLDVAIMYVAVDLLSLDSTLWKLISNIIVIILNYAAGKLIVFKKK